MEATYELIPRYDTHRSFHGKARVQLNDGDVELISCNTRVAIIYADGHARVFGAYNATTLRHITEFLKQNGFKADSKRQILADYASRPLGGSNMSGQDRFEAGLYLIAEADDGMAAVMIDKAIEQLQMMKNAREIIPF